MTTASPVVASYGLAYGVNNLRQDSLIAVNADVQSLAKEINYGEMVELSRPFDASGLMAKPEWRYIGTRQGYHYPAYYPPTLGMRRIYRIHGSQYHINDPFDLIPVSSGWRAAQPPGPGLSWNQETNRIYWLEPLQPATNVFSTNLMFFKYRLEFAPAEPRQ